MAEDLSFSKRYNTYPGKTLENYYLERIVAELETGPVFLAHHTQAKTLHRLRFLALPTGLTPEERLVYLGHFQRAASKVTTLEHPTLLPLTAYGIYQSTPYMVSPELPRHTLHTMLAKNGPADVLFAGRYLDQVTAALEYAHQQGILHLNLNAPGIFIKADGQLLVADCGLVRMLTSRTPVAVSEQQATLENGAALFLDQQRKPLYGLSIASAPAPELLLGQVVDTSADVYALGALLYQLLTGHRVFRGKTLQEIAQQHLSAEVPALSRWRQGLPPELDRVLGKALAKDPMRRFRSPGELANAYAQVATPGQGGRRAFAIAAPPPLAPIQPASPVQMPSRPSAIPARPSANRQVPLSRRRAINLIAAGGGVAVAAGVAVWFVAHNGASGSAPVASSGSTPAPGTGSGGTTSASSGGALAQASDIPVNSAKTFPLANSSNPGVLIHLPDGKFVAFNSTCTHAGCPVKYNPQDHLLECPCHGASFDPSRNAAVVGGPAPTPLTSIPITVSADGTITEDK